MNSSESRMASPAANPYLIRAAARIILKQRDIARQQLEEKRSLVGKPDVIPAYEFLYWTHTPEGILIRFKVPKGGRGKGASWAIADRLLEKAHTQYSLILCTREVQNSIADSVHRLLINRIRALGYSEFFHYTKNSIVNKMTGSEFLFRGLNDLTVDAVKSMEGITDVWLAEAHNVGAKSWLVLEPTIRTEGSTLYVDYNPDTEDAPTNVKFTIECPDNAVVRHLTYADNPYFPEVLEKLRQQSLASIENAMNEDARAQAQLDYNYVWLGHTRKVGKASIFGAFHIIEAFDPLTDPGEWDGPYDGADWGFSQDPTVRLRVWIHTKPNGKKRLCIEREAYGIGVEIKDLPAMFDVFPDSRKTKIRADNARPETISHMKGAGFRIVAAEKWKGSVEDGVEHMRGVYDIIVCHPRCTYTAKELVAYSYKVDRLTSEILTDIVDKDNHCLTADTLVETALGAIRIIDLVGKSGMVKTMQGLRKFHNVRQTSLREIIYRIEIDNGKHIDCTAEHLILTDKGWIPALALSSEYRIVSIMDAIRYENDKCQNISNLKASDSISAKTAIMFAQCLSIYIVKFGKSIMENIQRECISIISTITQKITTLAIYSSCPMPSTGSITLITLPMSSASTKEIISINMQDLPLLNGTNQRQGNNGIKYIMKKRQKHFMLGFQLFVSDAVRKLTCPTDARLHIARTLANLVTGENRKKIMFQGNVPIVVSSLASTNIDEQPLVASDVPCFYVGIKKITKLNHQPVYNMEVEDAHHFGVNGGMIVHNCMDACRYAIDPLITRKKGGYFYA